MALTFAGADFDKSQVSGAYLRAFIMERPTSGITGSNPITALSLTKSSIVSLGYSKSDLSVVIEPDQTYQNTFGATGVVTQKQTITVNCTQSGDFTFAVIDNILASDLCLLLINPDLITGNNATLGSQASPLTIALFFDNVNATCTYTRTQGEIINVAFTFEMTNKLSMGHKIGQNLSATLS